MMKYIVREEILKVFTLYPWGQQHMASIFVWILLQLFQRTQNNNRHVLIPTIIFLLQWALYENFRSERSDQRPRIEETKEVFYKPLTPGIKVAFVLGLGNHVVKNRCTLLCNPHPLRPPHITFLKSLISMLKSFYEI